MHRKMLSENTQTSVCGPCKENYRTHQYGKHYISCKIIILSSYGAAEHNKHSTLQEHVHERVRAAPAAASHSSSGGGGGRGGRWPMEELRHSSRSVYSSSHLAGGAHILARRAQDHRQPIFYFEKRTQETPTATAAAQQLHYTHKK